MAEFNIREINLPIIPEDTPEPLKEYLLELEIVLRQALIGSIYMEKVLEDGVIGN